MKQRISSLLKAVRSALRSRKTTTALIVANISWVTLFVVGWLPPKPQISPQKEKSVLKSRGPANEPVEIVETKVRTKAAKLGEGFEDEDDWLRYVTIKIKNKSEKAITFLHIDFDFPETKAIMGGTLVHQILLGKREDFELTLRQPSLYLKPNETIDISLDKEFNAIKEAIEFKHPSIGSINQVVIRIGDIVFDDGILFSGGMLFRRNTDPDSPRKWVRIPDPQEQPHSN